MRYQPEIYTYSHYQQRKKKNQKERNHYYYYFNLFNPEGTDHVLLTGDILTSYQQEKVMGHLRAAISGLLSL
jgi:hypothetical protein